MKVSDIANYIGATIVVGEDQGDFEVSSAFGSDLMSDVLAFIKDNSLLLTGLVSPHVVRTCEMLDVMVIVFVRGKVPSEEIIELAQDRDMIVMTTNMTLYEASGVLYQHGLGGTSSDE